MRLSQQQKQGLPGKAHEPPQEWLKTKTGTLASRTWPAWCDTHAPSASGGGALSPPPAPCPGGAASPTRLPRVDASSPTPGSVIPPTPAIASTTPASTSATRRQQASTQRSMTRREKQELLSTRANEAPITGDAVERRTTRRGDAKHTALAVRSVDAFRHRSSISENSYHLDDSPSISGSPSTAWPLGKTATGSSLPRGVSFGSPYGMQASKRTKHGPRSSEEEDRGLLPLLAMAAGPTGEDTRTFNTVHV